MNQSIVMNLYLYISSCATLNQTLTAQNIAILLHFPQNTLSGPKDRNLYP